MARNNRGVSLVESLVATALTGGMLYVMISFQLYMARENVQAAFALDTERRLNEIAKVIESAGVHNLIFPVYESNLTPTPQFNGPVNPEVSSESVSARWVWQSGEQYMYRLQPQLYGYRQGSSICIPNQRLQIDFALERQELTVSFERNILGNSPICRGSNAPSGERYSISATTWTEISDVQVVSSPGSNLLFLWFKSNGEWRSVTAGYRE